MAVEEAGRQWSSWVDSARGEIPELVLQEWRIFNERAGVPLEQVATGHEQRLCEALLTLHAIADEACAGVGIALDSSGRRRLRLPGARPRTAGQDRVAVADQPSFHASSAQGRDAAHGQTGILALRLQGPGISARWHKVPTRHRGTGITSEFATLLMLPWPMRVRESDFHPLEGSVQRLNNEPFGFFNFAPAESLDLDLLDRVLVAAREEVNSVDVVLLPESAIDEEEIAPLEDLLHRHGVNFVHAGVRERSKEPGQLPGNWMLSGINPRLEKGAKPPSETGEPWFRIRQNKHHRWSLDESQIYQYHLVESCTRMSVGGRR
jgi:hypothetical protein